MHVCCSWIHAAISRKVVGKSAHDDPERYGGWFWVHCSSKKFERMTREAMDVCLWVLKESKKNRCDGYSVRNRVLIISHITFQDCPVLIFSDNLSQNSCMWYVLVGKNIRSQFFKMWMVLVLFTGYISYSVSGTLMVYQILIHWIVIYWVEKLW